MLVSFPVGFALIGKITRIPRRGTRDIFKARVVSSFAKPVFAVPVIALHAMHDTVPIATLRRMDRLADLMRFIEKVVK